jgi:TatD DNase family protein
MLIDSHCHLDFPDFEDELADVVTRARTAGIGHFLTICTSLRKFVQVRKVAEQYGDISCSVGVHPHNAEDEPDFTAAELIELAEHPKVVAFGETGLDFFYDHSSQKRQEVLFRLHIEAAQQTGLPVIVHARDADSRMIEILTEEQGKGEFPGVIHCFSGGYALAAAVLEMGFYISLSGIVTFKSAEPLREVIQNVPIKRILVETDSPYLAPVPKRGKRNEPAFTTYTAAKVAEIKGISPDELAAVTTANFFRLFSKAADTGPL